MKIQSLATLSLISCTCVFLAHCGFAVAGGPGGPGGPPAGPSGSISSNSLTFTGTASPWHLTGASTFNLKVDRHALTDYEFKSYVKLRVDNASGNIIYNDMRTDTVLPGDTKTFSMGNGTPGTATALPRKYVWYASLWVDDGGFQIVTDGAASVVVQ